MLSPDLNIPSKSSTSEEWIAWYKSLKAIGASKDEANARFIIAWKDRGTDSANNDALRKYMLSKGITIKADWKDVLVDTLTWTPFSELGLNFRTIGYASLVFVGILLIIVLIALFNMARKPELVLNRIPTF